jgi:hypothetical protein
VILSYCLLYHQFTHQRLVTVFTQFFTVFSRQRNREANLCSVCRPDSRVEHPPPPPEPVISEQLSIFMSRPVMNIVFIKGIRQKKPFFETEFQDAHNLYKLRNAERIRRN